MFCLYIYIYIYMVFLDCDFILLPVKLWAMPLDDFEHDVADYHLGDSDNHRLP